MKTAGSQACKQVYSTQEIQPAQLDFLFLRDDCCNLHEWEGEIQLNFKHSLVITKAVSGSHIPLRQR